MPIMSKKYPMSVAHSRELKEMLGLPPKLPSHPYSIGWTIQGYYVSLLPVWSARQMRGHANKPHRLIVECKACCCKFSFGRLAQHERACKQMDNYTG